MMPRGLMRVVSPGGKRPSTYEEGLRHGSLVIGTRDGRFPGDPHHGSLCVRLFAVYSSLRTTGQAADQEPIALAGAQAVTGLASDRQLLGAIGQQPGSSRPMAPRS